MSPPALPAPGPPTRTGSPAERDDAGRDQEAERAEGVEQAGAPTPRRAARRHVARHDGEVEERDPGRGDEREREEVATPRGEEQREQHADHEVAPAHRAAQGERPGVLEQDAELERRDARRDESADADAEQTEDHEDAECESEHAAAVWPSSCRGLRSAPSRRTPWPIPSAASAVSRR